MLSFTYTNSFLSVDCISFGSVTSYQLMFSSQPTLSKGARVSYLVFVLSLFHYLRIIINSKGWKRSIVGNFNIDNMNIYKQLVRTQTKHNPNDRSVIYCEPPI